MTTLGSRKGRHAAIVEINMVPFIDVVLVLLIIFMVLTPFLVQQQMSVNLPQAASGTPAPDRPIVVGVQTQGELTLEGKPIAAADLEGSLKGLLASNKDRAIVVQADKVTSVQQVISVMDIARRLGVGKVGISVEQPK